MDNIGINIKKLLHTLCKTNCIDKVVLKKDAFEAFCKYLDITNKSIYGSGMYHIQLKDGLKFRGIEIECSELKKEKENGNN